VNSSTPTAIIVSRAGARARTQTAFLFSGVRATNRIVSVIAGTFSPAFIGDITTAPAAN